ncbi:hypothetical protein GALMADRAFT_1065773 [Galerina marginata CBS 339.88]|uniref:Clathrin/coatomer adaptor adaptin-like N-terminal domain-containing protein n=1 Tax=Galerina marginata (strain CBS 339.88) TaxID=685588 RepID=A0A067SAD5_GALM3|nr:hypothetical protein GALMADRAFT_1065773 [Galerina marginata CBS 339.88]
MYDIEQKLMLKGSDDQKSIIDTLRELSKQGSFTKVIERVLPRIVYLSIYSSSRTSGAAICALQEFYDQTILANAVEREMLQAHAHIFLSLSDQDRNVVRTAVFACAEFSKQLNLSPKIKKAVHQLVKKLTDMIASDPRSNIRLAVVTVLGEISSQSELVNEIEGAVNYVLQNIEDDDPLLRKAVVDTFNRFSEQPKLVNMIMGGLPKLVGRLKDNDPYVRHSVVAAIDNFSNLPGFMEAIEGELPGLLGVGDSGVPETSQKALYNTHKHDIILPSYPISLVSKTFSSWQI